MSTVLLLLANFGAGGVPSRSNLAPPLAVTYFVACALLAGDALLALVRAQQHPRVGRTERVIGLLQSVLATGFTVTAFANLYFVASQRRPGSFSEPLSSIDAVYFAATTFTTTGYGDISPRSQLCRLLVSGQLVVDLLLAGLLLTAVANLLLDEPPCYRGAGEGHE